MCLRVLTLRVVLWDWYVLWCAYCKLGVAASGVFDLVGCWMAWFWWAACCGWFDFIMGVICYALSLVGVGWDFGVHWFC